MSMKEAFDTFFEEMTQNHMKKWGVPPLATCNEERSPTGLFILETLDDEGYAQWNPKLQEKPVSFDNVEKELGFSIHPQIKAFLSTYWFLALDGIIQTSRGEAELRLNGLTPYSNLEERIISDFNNEETHYLHDHKYFLIGTFCSIGGNDSYLVQVNNDTGEVTAVEVMDKRSVKLADSIEELLMNMKGIW
ncbi:MAG: SecY-interacting protein Syd [Oscillospiraceae bacterium]|nr:SecY-interacting protein Syd [Oscillospiraceae bacterium]